MRTCIGKDAFGPRGRPGTTTGVGCRCVRGPDDALGVVGGKCTKEVGKDGKHLDGNPRHNNPKMEIYGTMEVYWD